MDLLIEAILDLVLESSIGASKSKKVPKFIRIILICLITLFFASVIGLLLFMGIVILKDNLIGGIVIILFALLFLILTILRFKKIYLEKK